MAQALQVPVNVLTSSGRPNDVEPELLNVLCTHPFTKAAKVISQGNWIYVQKKKHELKDYTEGELKSLSEGLLDYVKSSKFIKKEDYAIAVSDGHGIVATLSPSGVILAEVL